MQELRPMTTTNISQHWENSLSSWLTTLENSQACLSCSLQSCTPSSRSTSSANFTTPLQDSWSSSRRPATKSSLRQTNTSTAVWWLQPWAQEQRTSLKSAASLKQLLMFAQSSRSTTSSTKTSHRANGNSPSMLSSPGWMPTAKDATISST